MHGHFQISDAIHQHVPDQHWGQDDRVSKNWFTSFMKYHNSCVKKAHRPMCRIKQAIMRINQRCLGIPKLLKLLLRLSLRNDLFDLGFLEDQKNYMHVLC